MLPFSTLLSAVTLYCGLAHGKQEGTTALSQFSLGALKHSSKLFNVVVSDTHFVGRLFGTSIYQVKGVDIVPMETPAGTVIPENKNKDVAGVKMEVIKSFLDSAGFYFGDTGGHDGAYKLWTTVECNQDPTKCPVPSNGVEYDRYFVNNLEMLKMAKGTAIANTVQAIRGVISMKCFMVDTPSAPKQQQQVCATVMSRTSAYRTAPRMFSRGADTDGHAGNCAEVETIVANGRTAASFVQFRGSIPFIWSQPPSWFRVMPAVVLHGKEGESELAFNRHMSHMHQLYNTYDEYKLLSLIDSEGNLEKDLANTFTKFFNKFTASNTTGKPFKFIPFTFNASVNQKDDSALAAGEQRWQEPWFSNLKRQIDLDKVGFTLVKDGKRISESQKQIIRTSCLSTLDRTSAVQRQLSDYQTLHMLNAVLGFPPASSDAFKAPPPDMLQWLAQSWVSLANTIAFQYAGSDAKKTDIILTGKSSVQGRLKDYSVLTAQRHINANYFDKAKRDAMEVIYGTRATEMF